MKNLAAGVAFLGAIVAANVVAAGVLLVLGELARESLPEDYELAGIGVAAVLAVASALIFLRGALRVAIDVLSFLESKPARRGG